MRSPAGCLAESKLGEGKVGGKKREGEIHQVCCICLGFEMCLSSVETIYFIAVIAIQDAHKEFPGGVKYPYRQEMLPNITEKCMPPPEKRMLGLILLFLSSKSRSLLCLKLWNPGVCEHKVYAQLAFSTRHRPGFNRGSGRVTG